MSHFYFAWVEPTDTTFIDAFKRDDEEVFGMSIVHSEGDFPSMDVDLVNPRVGLLGAGRKQWAWMSWTDDSNVNHPLFFGRLVGIPQSMQNSIIRLTFIARPLDYEDQRQTLLADEIASSEVYDPVWLSAEDQVNPDSILETRSALFHIDRTTLAVTVSDIIEPEDGTVSFDPGDVVYDSLDVSYSETPASKCIVTATVNWTQRGAGGFPITNQIIQAFANGHTEKGLFTARDNPVSGDGMIALIPGKDMIANWPKVGASFGGGWSVTASSISPVGPAPLDPILVPYYNHWLRVQALLADGSVRQSFALQNLFERSPGFVVQIVPSWVTDSPFGTAHGPIDIIWFPIWLLAPTLSVGWNAARPRSEVVSFTLEADVQPLLTDPDGQEVIRLTLGPADVDMAIANIANSRYFSTERGIRSFQSLLARARAALLARARAVEVKFDLAFEVAIGLSCRKGGEVSDARLPGGIVAGKVKSYTLTADGDSGTLLGSVVLGSTVGRDGTVSESGGTAVYCDPDYVGADYQLYTGRTANIPGYTDLTYAGMDDYAIVDDGVNLNSVRAGEYLESIEVAGTIDEQQPVAQDTSAMASSSPEVIAKVSGFTTTVTVKMRPISDNAFDTTITPTVSELKVPKTIDLEAV